MVKRLMNLKHYGCYYSVCFLFEEKVKLLQDVKNDTVHKRIEEVMEEIEKILDEEKGIKRTEFSFCKILINSTWHIYSISLIWVQ